MVKWHKSKMDFKTTVQGSVELICLVRKEPNGGCNENSIETSFFT
jgi:hypothetical protein